MSNDQQYIDHDKLHEIESRQIEKAFMVGIQHQDESEQSTHELIDELKSLLNTAGIGVSGRFVAKLNQPRPRYYVGSGKANEIIEAAKEAGADSIIFDDALTPAQQRNWERLAQLTVVDRQEIILDIFAQRATTREAELQVALARAEYDLPRLKRRWTHLSRQSGRGGTGVKGEGEQQIELDSRMINQRITRLKRELETVEKKRDIDRKRRIENPIPKVAIVGYTNAGKSSLLNRFSGADVLAENKLFATLSATTRRTVLPNNMEVLLSDTVGFVRKLPHSLVEAFKSTLEEASYCDFVIEVVDATSPQFEEHHRLTTEVLQEIGAGQKPSLIVVNKVDLIENNYEKAKYRRVFNNPVFVSTHTGEGMEQLQERLMQEFESLRQSLEALIPFDRYDLMALVHRTGDVLSEEATAEGTMVEASVPKRVASCLKPYQLNA